MFTNKHYISWTSINKGFIYNMSLITYTTANMLRYWLIIWLQSIPDVYVYNSDDRITTVVYYLSAVPGTKVQDYKSFMNKILTFAVVDTLAADCSSCFIIGTHDTVILQWVVLIVATLAVSTTFSGAIAEVLPRWAVSCSCRIAIKTSD